MSKRKARPSRGHHDKEFADYEAYIARAAPFVIKQRGAEEWAAFAWTPYDDTPFGKQKCEDTAIVFRNYARRHVPPVLAERGFREEAGRLARCDDQRSREIIDELAWAVNCARDKALAARTDKKAKPPWSVEGPARCAGFAKVLRGAGIREARAEWFYKQLRVSPPGADPADYDE